MSLGEIADFIANRVVDRIVESGYPRTGVHWNELKTIRPSSIPSAKKYLIRQKSNWEDGGFDVVVAVYDINDRCFRTYKEKLTIADEWITHWTDYPFEEQK